MREGSLRPDRLKLGQSLGRNPQHRPGRVQLGNAPLPRQLGENTLEPGGVFGAKIWRHFHSGEHNLNGWIFRFRFVDDRLEICFHRLQVEPAQTVVGPELEHQNVDRPLEEPVDPAQPTRARVAAQSGVLDFEG